MNISNSGFAKNAASPGLDNAACAIFPVILCGGSGSRLWPVSRENYPKPFVRLDNDRTLFKDTLERSGRLAGGKCPVIVCNETHRFYVQEALAQCRMEGRIILEREGRNTAPAIALAAFALAGQNPDALLLAMPSDHAIDDTDKFCKAAAMAAQTALSGKIITFGIQPSGPECGFGYIHAAKPLPGGCVGVSRFVEKPGPTQAREMLAQGGYYWNSGIFLMRAATYLDELQKCSPDIYAACAAAWQGRQTDMGFIRPDWTALKACPEDSIDYAVMEKTGLAAMMPLDLQWSDLGSWQSFYESGRQDENGNVTQGDVLAIDARGCYLNSQDKLLAVAGVNGLAVVETRDAVLVIPRDKSQDVKKIVLELKKANRGEYRDPAIVCRPWGSFEQLAQGARFQVKKIVVKPGAALSLQLHHHRAEHWVIVRGTAQVTVDGTEKLLTENESVYIPVGSRHKLANPGIIPLEIIEIQSGPYLGEDDIQRFEDIYGRI